MHRQFGYDYGPHEYAVLVFGKIVKYHVCVGFSTNSC